MTSDRTTKAVARPAAPPVVPRTSCTLGAGLALAARRSVSAPGLGDLGPLGLAGLATLAGGEAGGRSATRFAGRVGGTGGGGGEGVGGQPGLVQGILEVEGGMKGHTPVLTIMKWAKIPKRYEQILHLITS